MDKYVLYIYTNNTLVQDEVVDDPIHALKRVVAIVEQMRGFHYTKIECYRILTVRTKERQWQLKID